MARLVVGLSLIAALVAAWLWTPLGTMTDVDSITPLLAPLRSRWWGYPLTVSAAAVCAALFVPLTPMVVAIVLIYGATTGFALSLLSSVLSAGLSHVVGRTLLRNSLQQLLVRRLPFVARQLAQHDFRATLTIRFIPGAPFALMNLLAGSAGIRLRYFLPGTLIGVLPPVALLTWASQGVLELLRRPSEADLTQLALAFGAAVLVVLAATLGRRRWMRRRYF